MYEALSLKPLVYDVLRVWWQAEDRTGHGSEEFRCLKEARDLEDCLFS